MSASTAGSPAQAPLDCPEQLLAWQPGALDRLCRATVELAPRQGTHDGPQLLACHDMAGGYGEDRFVQGGSDASFYRLRRWACVDTFVYFSHRLVTIPPPGWTNAAHAHGVRVLGTLITEWGPGRAACCRLFGTQQAAEAGAERLAQVAAYHGFEGWLINIENEVEPGHIPHLLHFLRVLTERMREVAPGWSQVIWYDAVTTEGKLEWQDTLNALNRPFLDACDALWVNYTWKEGTPEAVRQEAGDRAADVYMGVDCFGRGTYGGGGFACDVALKAALEQGLSAALFATGWPYEGDCGPDAPACWRQRDALFWDGIEAAWRGGRCCTDAEDGSHTPVGAAGHARPAYQRLPLYSNFCAGSGLAFFQGGRQLASRPWYNLSLQGLQPLLRVHHDVHPLQGQASSSAAGEGGGDGCGAPTSRCAVQVDTIDERAFSGCSSVLVSGTLQPGQRATIQLFEAAADVPAAGVWVRLTAMLAGAVDAKLVLRFAAGQTPPDTGSMAAWGPAGLPLDAAAAELTPLFGAGPRVAADAAQDAAAAAAAVAAEAEAAPFMEAATGLDPAPQVAPLTGDRASRMVCLAASPCSHAAAVSGAARDSAACAAAGAPAWQTFQFRIPGGLLAAAAGCAVVLSSVDLLLLGASAGAGCSGGDGPGPAPFELLLGELCIEEAGPSCQPAPPGSVASLRCDALCLTGAGAGAGEDGSGDSCPATVSARLEWEPPSSGTRCCHVWCAFEGEAGEAVGEPVWVGAACADGFWVAGLQVPAGATSVAFLVQTEGRNGLMQELVCSARITVRLPPGGQG